MSVHVHGKVSITNGTAFLELQPSQPARCDTKARPSPDDITQRIQDGSIIVHRSRSPLTREAVNLALVTVQKKLGLQTGTAKEGQTKLTKCSQKAENLSSSKKGSSTTLEKAKRPLLALPAPPVTPVVEDKGQESSSASSSEESQDPSAKKAKESSSSSSSSSSSPSSSSSSSSTSSSFTHKSVLRHKIEKLNADCEEVMQAIGCHQEIEQENEELKSLCRGLTPAVVFQAFIDFLVSGFMRPSSIRSRPQSVARADLS